MVDIVLRIRPEAYDASFELLTADIAHAVLQLKRWHRTLDTTARQTETPPLQVGDTQ
jgi:hypothetical protein